MPVIKKKVHMSVIKKYILLQLMKLCLKLYNELKVCNLQSFFHAL